MRAMVGAMFALTVLSPANTAGAASPEFTYRISPMPLRGLEITSGPCTGLTGDLDGLKRQCGCVIEQGLRVTMSGNPLFASSKQVAVYLACVDRPLRAD